MPQTKVGVLLRAILWKGLWSNKEKRLHINVLELKRISLALKLQEQGFSVEVADRIAAPQKLSTRTIYQSKWSPFEKWCRENLVDFSTPSVNQVLDFFMYLYKDLNRLPSTIDGYRTATVYTLCPAGLHIS